MEILIVPAVIANTQSELDNILGRLQGYASRVMLDFMDGGFVSSYSLNFPLRLPDTFEYEAHLMVREPMKWIPRIPKAVTTITVHYESQNFQKALSEARRLGCSVYLGLNPPTHIDVIKPYLNVINGVMVMTVEPGRYGALFLPEMLDKVRALRAMSRDILIEVDGGMNPMNAGLAVKAGANMVASGSYIIKSEDVARSIHELKKATMTE